MMATFALMILATLTVANVFTPRITATMAMHATSNSAIQPLDATQLLTTLASIAMILQTARLILAIQQLVAFTPILPAWITIPAPKIHVNRLEVATSRL